MKLCLNMIVKNEMANIERCLTSIAPYISCWVIGDTGSTDGTQDFIRSFFAQRNIPGELHEFPFENFSQARNKALECARASALKFDYILLSDADMELQVSDLECLKGLTAKAYLVIQRAGITYWNIRLVHRSSKALYHGVTHEFLDITDGNTENIQGIFYIDHATGSSRVEKYERDSQLLRDALAQEQNPGMIARYWFYYANTLREAGHAEEALQAYMKRSELGHWDQEVFMSLYNAAQIKEALGYPFDDVIAAYLLASDLFPSRAEALHDAARYCRNHNAPEKGYEFAKRGSTIAYPYDGLFVADWIYHFGLRDEMAVNAYWIGGYKESLDICLELLESENLPDHERPRIIANARHAVNGMHSNPTLSGLNVKLKPLESRPKILETARFFGSPKPDELVSLISPTGNRADFLKKALKCFINQSYQNIEWLILDDSNGATAPFHLVDERIQYTHIDQKLSIGEKRNLLVAQAKGSIIIHFDDDDYYGPDYVAHMVQHLNAQKADIIYLDGWYLYDVRSKFFAYWDLLSFQGPHYRCDADGVALVYLDDANNHDFRDMQFGFSFAYRKRVWEAGAFEAINWGEDGAFLREARKAFKVSSFSDTGGLCIHYLHEGSSSRCYPQYALPEGLLNKLFPNLVEHSALPTLSENPSGSTARNEGIDANVNGASSTANPNKNKYNFYHHDYALVEVVHEHWKDLFRLRRFDRAIIDTYGTVRGTYEIKKDILIIIWNEYPEEIFKKYNGKYFQYNMIKYANKFEIINSNMNNFNYFIDSYSSHEFDINFEKLTPFQKKLLLARQLEATSKEASDIVAAFKNAIDVDGARPEPWYELARFFRISGNYTEALLWAQGGLDLRDPGEVPCREDWIYHYGLRHEFALCGRHIEDPELKAQGHLICEELSLDRSIPSKIRELARENLRYYVKSLFENAPSVNVLKLKLDEPAGFASLNPSILKTNDGFSIVQRISNYFVDENGYYVVTNSDRFETRNFLVELDTNFKINSSNEILISSGTLPLFYDHVLGLEDLRLFHWRGERWCVGNSRQANSDGWTEQFIGRIDQNSDGSIYLNELRKLVPPLDRDHEKNWIPIIDGDQLNFIQSHDPFRRLDQDANIVAKKTSVMAVEHFRGSSQAIPFDGGWLALIHEVTLIGRNKFYFHRFEWLDRHMNLSHITKAFYIVQKGIEFCVGLTSDHDDEHLVFSFGVMDKECYLAKISRNDVRQMLGLQSQS